MSEPSTLEVFGASASLSQTPSIASNDVGPLKVAIVRNSER